MVASPVMCRLRRVTADEVVSTYEPTLREREPDCEIAWPRFMKSPVATTSEARTKPEFAFSRFAKCDCAGLAKDTVCDVAPWSTVTWLPEGAKLCGFPVCSKLPATTSAPSV